MILDLPYASGPFIPLSYMVDPQPVEAPESRRDAWPEIISSPVLPAQYIARLFAGEGWVPSTSGLFHCTE